MFRSPKRVENTTSTRAGWLLTLAGHQSSERPVKITEAVGFRKVSEGSLMFRAMLQRLVRLALEVAHGPLGGMPGATAGETPAATGVRLIRAIPGRRATGLDNISSRELGRCWRESPPDKSLEKGFRSGAPGVYEKGTAPGTSRSCAPKKCC